MGLDITAYGEARILPVAEDYNDRDEPNIDYHRAFCYTGFESSTAGLKLERWYHCSRFGALRFRAGSYGSYSHWREQLAKLAGYTPQEAWDAPEDHREAPFFLLVNFADNEGTIGPTAADELSADFTSLHELMRHQWRHNPQHQLLYRQWTAATCLAADSGLINFG